MMALSLSVITAVAVFMHGQFGGNSPFKRPARIGATLVVALVISYATGLLWFQYFRAVWLAWCAAALAAVIAGHAFAWGPEIGWNNAVLRTQIIKGAWLTATLFPFGLLYAALRPFAYWVGYARAASAGVDSDIIARMLSGLSLGAVVGLVLAFNDCLPSDLVGVAHAIPTFFAESYSGIHKEISLQWAGFGML